jgi:hypothetical protein
MRAKACRFFPTTESIAARTGLTERAVADAVKTLMGSGLVAGTIIGDPDSTKYSNLMVQGPGLRFYELAIEQQQ